MKTIIKRILISILAIFILFLMWITGFPYPFYLNNYHAHQFGKQLTRLELPPQTVKIGHVYTAYGNLVGQSNKGGYFAGILVQSNLSLDQLSQYYSTYKIKPAEPPYHFPIDVEVFIIKGLNIKSPDSLDAMPFKNKLTLSPRWFGISSKEAKKLSENLYMIYSFDSPYKANDIRCY
ncbi:MAG: hypothetical protein WC860_02890 [Candidatus Margulisiibacteriota bacterium]|jgi:hypothetical protein